MTPPVTRQRLREQPPISVAEEQTVRGVSVKLVPLGVITGKVVDEDGEPVPNAAVVAWHYRFSAEGPVLERTDWANADDRGLYRMHGMKPDRYFLQSFLMVERPEVPGGPEHLHSTIPEEGLAPVWFPKGSDASQAGALLVTGGGELTGIDFRLSRVPLLHVRGQFRGTLPRQVRLEFGNCTGSVHDQIASAQVRSDGTFDVSGAFPATYCLIPDGPGLLPDAALTVKEGDVNLPALTVAPALNLAGVLRMEGGAPLPASKPEILLRSRGFLWREPIIAPDGSFAVQWVLPGHYVLEMSGLPKGAYIQSMELSGRDVTDGDIVVTAAGTLTVVLAANAGQLTGTVQDSDGRPGDHMMVVIAPKAANLRRPDLCQAVNTGADGSFRFASVAPGEYRVLALETFDSALSRLPEFQKEFEGSAATVTVSASQSASVQLKAIAADAVEAAKGKLP